MFKVNADLLKRYCEFMGLGCVRKLALASSGLFSFWTASGSIDDTNYIACFAVLAR
jgi:hypothetical protein